jgi:hypothetical protein
MNRSPSLFTVVTLAALALLVGHLPSQQPNSHGATLTINGQPGGPPYPIEAGG